MSAGSSSASVPSIDEIVKAISTTQPADLERQLIPQLKKLDKAASHSRASGPSAASTSSSSAGNAAGAGSSGAGQAGHVLEGMLKDGRDPLDVLDATSHSVGYLWILNARLVSTSRAELPKMVQKVNDWVSASDVEQARLSLAVDFLAKQLCTLAEHSRQASLPLQPLNTLLTRFPLPGHLTSLHTLFLRCVMASHMYPAAQEVLSRDITDVDKSLFPIRYQDHLLYHYLGGTILALLGNYARAADLLEICVSAPSSSASLIQIDAYKKLVLVQLLAYGKTQALPRYTSQVVLTAAKTLCAPYLEYCSAFASLNRERVDQAREKGREAFEKDYNSGLVAFCDESLRRRQIQNLTETYITLSLGQIASYVGLDATSERDLEIVKGEVEGMITSKQIYAELSPSTDPSASLAATTVTFTDDPEPYLSHETVARVTQAIEKAQVLQQRWDREQQKVEASKEFVTKAWSAAASGASAAAGGAFGSMGFGDDIDFGSTGGSGMPGGMEWVDKGDIIEMDSD
ncbi:hypothetical protein NBRC10512_006384 [Rhodotorula toruloides]|uniref:COP9 signalosome complex subunit 3 n=1 Tax=Rhodotorula toruloides (strain NP11) TaxID=1130832 RepID=M7WH61_RHOT1|nr:COP9 signalosome complex subunit 3 [Rhodotorula toruloides NP11]EMS19777.1 COP9 signalosome complex subunit 3 [Rhodotorula toruloides NP11]